MQTITDWISAGTKFIDMVADTFSSESGPQSDLFYDACKEVTDETPTIDEMIANTGYEPVEKILLEKDIMIAKDGETGTSLLIFGSNTEFSQFVWDIKRLNEMDKKLTSLSGDFKIHSYDDFKDNGFSNDYERDDDDDIKAAFEKDDGSDSCESSDDEISRAETNQPEDDLSNPIEDAIVSSQSQTNFQDDCEADEEEEDSYAKPSQKLRNRNGKFKKIFRTEIVEKYMTENESQQKGQPTAEAAQVFYFIDQTILYTAYLMKVKRKEDKTKNVNNQLK
jgi:hypothetical protein